MYNKFSDLYDELVFDIDYDYYMSNIENILTEKNIKSGNILEIACGTGNLTQRLADSNYNILAFDYSEEMLSYAYAKLRDFHNVKVENHNMYDFSYENKEYDVIITLLDVINYITDESQLKLLFKNIYSGLKEGGVFIFDLNSKYKLFEILGDNHFVYEYNNIFYTWESEREEDLIYFYLNFFVEDENGKYDRIEENQTERYYSIEFIVKVLKEIGFKNINYIDEDGGEYTEITQRILFSAEK